MKFEVKFAKKTRNYAVVLRTSGRDVGLEGLRFLRDEFVSWIEPEDVKPTVDFMEINSIKIEIDEKAATKSGFFEKQNETEVVITGGNLENYCQWKGREYKNGTYRFELCWEFPEEKIIRDWAAAGFPSEWDISEEE